MSWQVLQDLREQQASSLAYFDVFWVVGVMSFVPCLSRAAHEALGCRKRGSCRRRVSLVGPFLTRRSQLRYRHPDRFVGIIGILRARKFASLVSSGHPPFRTCRLNRLRRLRSACAIARWLRLRSSMPARATAVTREQFDRPRAKDLLAFPSSAALKSGSAWSRCRSACLMLAALTCGCTGPSEYIHNGFKVGPNYCPPGSRRRPDLDRRAPTNACGPTLTT